MPGGYYSVGDAWAFFVVGAAIVFGIGGIVTLAALFIEWLYKKLFWRRFF